jgi:dTDP-4-amino-4,6-dideoxy-D-galactose acyltransferase
VTYLSVDDSKRSQPTPSAVCKYLDWDSRFFGVRIGQVQGSRLDSEFLRRVIDYAQRESLECLYFLADFDANTIHLAEQADFHLVDVRLTLEARPGDIDLTGHSDDLVRQALPQDIPLLRDIAASSHTDSRFYKDPNFSRHLCDEMYRVWIEKSCTGGAEVVLVANHDSRPAGYISCHVHAGGQGQIGLVGVAPDARNMGIGRMLLQRALCWFHGRRIAEVIVITQGSNVGAQRLYQKSGFRSRNLQLWYHFWRSGKCELGKPC